MDLGENQPLADLEEGEREDETFSTLLQRHWGDDARVRRYAAIVECHCQHGQPSVAVTQLLIREQNEEEALSSAVPCFSAFRRACSAEPGWETVLAAAWRAAAPECNVPPALLEDFVGALQFAERQLRNLGAGDAWGGIPPHSLLALISGMPADEAAGLLFTPPQRFQQFVEPWLRAELLWGDADVASAALSGVYPDLQSTEAAQRSLDWLLGLGLTRCQAGRALSGCLPLLTEPPQQERVAELAAAWDVGAGLAATLALTLGDYGRVAGSRADLSREVLEILVVSMGRGAGGGAACPLSSA